MAHYEVQQDGNFPPMNGYFVRLGTDLRVNSGPSWFILRQESGNVNLGRHSGLEHAMTLKNGLLYVSRHRDVEGRCCVSYIRVQFDTLSSAENYMRSQRPAGGQISIPALSLCR